MPSTPFLAVAVAFAVASVGLAWGQVVRASGTIGDLVPLAASLRRVRAGDRLAELQRRVKAGSWEHSLASEALAAADSDALVAAVNLALSEADHALSRGAGWPRSGARIALLGCGLLAFARFLTQGGHVGESIVLLATGGAAALACVEADRSSRRHVDRQRRAIDELVSVIFGDAATGEASCHIVDMGRPRRRGFGARRQGRGS